MSACSIFVRNAANFKGNIAIVPSAILQHHQAKRQVANLVFLGTKLALKNQKFIDKFPEYLNAHAKTILHVVENTSAKKASSIHLPVVGKESDEYTKVTIGVLPDDCSRNNCATRPDVITKLVRGLDLKSTGKQEKNESESCGTTDILCAVKVGNADTETVYRSIVSAIAKGFSHFSSKKRSLDGDFTSKGVPSSLSVSIVSTDDEGTHELTMPLAQKLEVIAESNQLCMFLVDAPPNLLTTTSFADIVSELATVHDYKIHTSLTGDKLVDANLTGIYNVGKGAVCPPMFLVLQYNQKKNHECNDPSLVLVGKGITYDSGGLALKPAASMVNMKCDMAGAALVFTTFLSLVRNKTAKNIYAVLCLAENSIGQFSYRNDDIIPLHSGLHVEINNTDAEGRIVLADGISFASQKLNPKHIFTLATLTGAQSYATGLNHAGVYTNLQSLEDACVEGGKETGDLVFPLLYCPEFLDEEFSSEVADMKNSVKNRNNASSSAAGRFLEKSLDKSYTGGFAHLDIASPAFQKDRATGYGVNLLSTLIEKL